jgi:single-strand DNA-binding protein
MNLNRFTIIGRLTKDVELRSTQGGKSVANINVATNFVFKDQQGNKVEKAEYHRLIAWGGQADTIAKDCVKGQEMMFEGRISYSQYEKDGTKVYRTDLIISDFSFGAKSQGSTQRQPTPAEVVEQAGMGRPTSIDEDIKVEDIPF